MIVDLLDQFRAVSTGHASGIDGAVPGLVRANHQAELTGALGGVKLQSGAELKVFVLRPGQPVPRSRRTASHQPSTRPPPIATGGDRRCSCRHPLARPGVLRGPVETLDDERPVLIRAYALGARQRGKRREPGGPVSLATDPMEEIRLPAPDAGPYGHIPGRQQAVIEGPLVGSLDAVRDAPRHAVVPAVDGHHVEATVQFEDRWALVVIAVAWSARGRLELPMVAVRAGEVTCAAAVVEQAPVLAGADESVKLAAVLDDVGITPVDPVVALLLGLVPAGVRLSHGVVLILLPVDQVLARRQSRDLGLSLREIGGVEQKPGVPFLPDTHCPNLVPVELAGFPGADGSG